MQVLIQLPLAHTTDLDLVRRTIEHVQLHLVPKLDSITDGPDILGLTEEKNGTFTVLVLLVAENGETDCHSRTFLAADFAALKSAGILDFTPPLNLTAGT